MGNKYELRHKWLMFCLLFMSVVVGAGWFATGYLGDMARQEIVKENEATITLLSTNLTDEFKRIEGTVKAMSGSPWIPPALISGNDQDIARANSILDRYNSAMRASVSYLMDKTGQTIASSNRNDPDSFVGKSYQFRPYFTQAISGHSGRYFALGVTSLKRGFYASFPVLDNRGAIIGVASIKMDLDDIEANFSGNSHFFFINPHGIIFLSSKKEMLFKSLWPVGRETERALLASKQFGEKPFEAVLSQIVADGMDITLNGKRYLASRKVIDPEGWSIVLMNPTDRIFLYRSIGVIMTLLICTFILIPLILSYKTARSEEHYRTLFNEILDGICLADAETGIIIDCNQALAALVCRERAELIGRPQTILHPPQDDKEAFSPTFKQHMIDKQEQVLETQVVTKTGDIRKVEIKAKSLNLQGRKVLQGIFHDITERKRAEEALLIIKKAVESSSDAIGMSDPQGHHFYQNKSFTNLFEYTAEELEAAGGGQVAFSSSDTAREVFDAIMNGKSWSGETEMTSKSGRRFPVLLRADAVKDDVGRIISVLGTFTDITERKRAEEELQRTLESLRKSFGTTIQVMVSAVETRDPYTAGHQIRSADLARTIATEMGLSQDTIEAIRMAGPIHDIGKLSIPAEILSKPTKLTNIEFSLIKEHSRRGYEMLKDVESPWPLAQIVYQHHERMDGSGYPRNLKGDDILMEARILAVSDVVESMASHRPYRPGLGIEVALEEIEKNKGILYDNTVADACLRLFREKGFKLKST